MNNGNIDIVTVSAETLETEAKAPAQEKIAARLDQAKSTGKERAKRIQAIFKAAVAEAISEVKGGSGEVWNISKSSIADVLELETPGIDTKMTADKTSATASAKTSGTASEAVSDAASDTASGPNPATSTPFWKSVLNQVKLKVQTQLKNEYENLPNRYGTVKKNAGEWDQALGEKYGDRYTQTKHTAKAAFTQAAAWYRQALEKAQTLDAPATPVEQKQTEFETEAAVVGARIAEKERAIKQQLKDTVQSIIAADA